MDFETLVYAFGAAAVAWVGGFAMGFAAGLVRRLRDVV